jgi:hypothetical protein
MKRGVALACAVAALFSITGDARPADPPVPAAQLDLTGVWGPYRAERESDPALLPPPAGPVVLKPEYAKQWEARRAAEADAIRRGESPGSPATLCVPYGMPRMMSVAIYPVEIIQTAKRITIVTEAFSEVRRVYLDRPQARIEDVPPGYYGRSVGHWDGKALVVDTIGIKTTVVGYQNLPHSDQMHIVERFHLVTPDVLHDDILIEDPIVLERPVTYTVAYRRMPAYEMVEFVCDNNREYLDQTGAVRMRLHDR